MNMTSDALENILSNLEGTTIVKAAHYIDNNGAGGEGISFIVDADDGRKRVDVGINAYDNEFYINEVEYEEGDD